MSEENEWKKFLISEEAKKIMDEIKEKVKNPETQLEALELIEKNLDELPMDAYWTVVEFTKSEDANVKEKAKRVLEKYHERFPQFIELRKSLETIRNIYPPLKEVLKVIETQQRVFKALTNIYSTSKIGEVVKVLAEQSKRLNEIAKELTIPELPKVDILKNVSILPRYYRLEVIEAKLDELYKEIQELKEIKQIEKEEYQKLKKKLKELEVELDRAYQ